VDGWYSSGSADHTVGSFARDTAHLPAVRNWCGVRHRLLWSVASPQQAEEQRLLDNWIVCQKSARAPTDETVSAGSDGGARAPETSNVVLCTAKEGSGASTKEQSQSS
jgi:hypothetical protein